MPPQSSNHLPVSDIKPYDLAIGSASVDMVLTGKDKLSEANVLLMVGDLLSQLILGQIVHVNVGVNTS